MQTDQMQSISQAAVGLSFRDVEQYLREKHPKLLDPLEDMLALIIIGSTVAGGPPATPLLGLLTAKTDLVNIGKKLLSTVSRKRKEDFLDNQRRMQVAYTLTCFTAFFEAFSRALPELQEKLDLKESEKQHLLKKSIRSLPQQRDDQVSGNLTGLDELRVPFPHPLHQLSTHAARLKPLYIELTKALLSFLDRLQLWSELPEAHREDLETRINQLPREALSLFEAQYRHLATRFQDFRIWSNIHEHRQTRKALSEAVQHHANMVKNQNRAIDVGFENLGKTIQSIPALVAANKANNIVLGLQQHYIPRLNDPVITEKLAVQEDETPITFPSIRSCYIPQSYQALLKKAGLTNVERDKTWEQLDRRSDLNAFLLSYLRSPYSFERPLLILGHPGSGKSLLTKVLAARLSSETFTPIRVPLRKVDSEATIQVQIEQAIKRATGRSLDSWADFSAERCNQPPVVLLDGYDELLQASGKTFRSYLQQVRNFQQNEREQRRPVRVIVTSRITLIDKVDIPDGTTVVRLLEFTRKQQDRWCAIWNRTNGRNFETSKTPIAPFEVPDDKNVQELAQQPLLLLMLAIYDSDKNRLRNEQSLDRCSLYNNLIGRFVHRELRKKSDYEDDTESNQKIRIETQVTRLGVAAIGMFIRQAVVIQSIELDDDLKYFGLRDKGRRRDTRLLTQAERLLGSFFFIHRSEARTGTDDEQPQEAFEFLHNTFGEYLAADFIARQIANELEDIRIEATRPVRLGNRQTAHRGNGKSEAWASCLNQALLSSRPLILKMILEWAPTVFDDMQLDKNEIQQDLDTLLYSTLQTILSGTDIQWMAARHDEEGATTSLLAQVATLSFNLCLLRATLAGGSYDLDESRLLAKARRAGNVRPWDQLIHLWRSAFGIAELVEASSSVRIRRDETTIHIKAFPPDHFPEDSCETSRLYATGSALGDNLLMGLSGAHFLQEYPSQGELNHTYISTLLSSEEIECNEFKQEGALREALSKDRSSIFNVLTEEDSQLGLSTALFFLTPLGYRLNFPESMISLEATAELLTTNPWPALSLEMLKAFIDRTQVAYPDNFLLDVTDTIYYQALDRDDIDFDAVIQIENRLNRRGGIRNSELAIFEVALYSENPRGLDAAVLIARRSKRLRIKLLSQSIERFTYLLRKHDIVLDWIKALRREREIEKNCLDFLKHITALFTINLDEDLLLQSFFLAKTFNDKLSHDVLLEKLSRNRAILHRFLEKHRETHPGRAIDLLESIQYSPERRDIIQYFLSEMFAVDPELFDYRKLSIGNLIEIQIMCAEYGLEPPLFMHHIFY